MSIIQYVHEAYNFDSAKDQAWWYDDFRGDSLHERWRDTGDAGGSATTINAVKNGICRITTGAVVDDDWRIDWNDIRSLYTEENPALEVYCAFDIAGTGHRPVIALWYNTNRHFMFLKTTGNWLAENKAATGTTQEDTGVAGSTDYMLFRIETYGDGSGVKYSINGTLVATITDDIPTGVEGHFQPYIWNQTKTAAARVVDIDYVAWRCDRT